MKALVQLDNVTAHAIYLPAMPGYSLGFTLAPGTTDIPADYWDMLCSKRAHTMRRFVGKDIKAAGKPQDASAPAPAPTRAPAPAPAPTRAPAPGSLEGLSKEQYADAIEACNDLEQIKVWGQSETREQVTDMLLARWRVLGGKA